MLPFEVLWVVNPFRVDTHRVDNGKRRSRGSNHATSNLADLIL